MSSKLIKKIGYGVAILGFIGGLIAFMELEMFIAICVWLSYALLVFFIEILGTVIEHQEYTNEYLKIIAVLKEKEMGEN